MKRAGLFLIAAVLALVVAVVGYYGWAAYLRSAPPPELFAITDRDIVLGDPDAAVKVVEYFSPSCGHCATFAETVAPALLAGPVADGTATLILRPVAYDRSTARAVGILHCMAGDAVTKKDAANILMADIKAWIEDGTGETQARLVGLEPAPALLSCAAAQADVVAEDTHTAIMTYGIPGTPTTFIGTSSGDNGSSIVGAVDPSEYLDAIEQTRAP